MRVVFLGNARWSVPSLRALAASAHRVEHVITRVPRPTGRTKRLTPTPVAEAARRLDLPLAEVETVRSGPGFQTLARAEPDWSLLEIPHLGLLPAVRWKLQNLEKLARTNPAKLQAMSDALDERLQSLP